MIRLPKRVERVGADDRVQRHARLARARADLADQLALERLLVEPALAGHDGARRAHARVEAERVEDPRRARLEHGAVRRPQPAAQAAGGAGHRHAARVARQPRGQLVEPRLQPRHHRRVGALLRPEHGGRALERRAHVGQHDDARAAQPAVLLDRLERAGAAVGRRRAADAEQHDLGARVDRGADQLARAVRRRRPRVALVLGHQPEARRRGHLEHGRAAVLDQAELALQRPPERVVHLGARRSRRRARAAAPPSSPRRRRPAGTGRAASARRARARGRSRRRPRRRGTCP